MLLKLKRLAHEYMSFKNHNLCRPAECNEAARLCNKYDSLWRMVEYTRSTGPCQYFDTPLHHCGRCLDFELADAIVNRERPIDDWL